MPGVSEQTCPNGCDLAEFGTHQGPPDCDLDPQPPDAAEQTRRRVELEGRLAGLDIPSLIHVRCGRPFGEHPHGSPNLGCPFDALAWREVEFAPAEPTIRVVALPNPGQLPAPVAEALTALAQACRDTYGMGVEVEGETGREVAREALDTLRRYFA